MIDLNAAQRQEEWRPPTGGGLEKRSPAPRTFEIDPESVLAAACWYSEVMEWPVFPVVDKKPTTRHGYHDASRDPERLRNWFQPGWEGFTRHIAIVTGISTGLVVVDIDIKPGCNGWESLADLGVQTCPETPVSHSPSGGTHLWFRHPGTGFHVKSLSPWVPGVDLKADRSSCSAPPAPGRTWDPHLNLLSLPLAPLPDWVPREEAGGDRQSGAPRIIVRERIERYGQVALENACQAIAGAENGAQQRTLNAEAYSIGRLVGGDEVPLALAKQALIWAAERMRAFREPWRPSEIAAIVERGLSDGQEKPRRRPDRK